MALIYSLVARGPTILAEWSDSAGNFATVTRILLSKISSGDSATNKGPSSSGSSARSSVNMVSYMYDGHVFHCLEQPGNVGDQCLRFMAMCERSAGVSIPYRFLENLRQAFISQYGLEMPQKVVALAYTESFGPKMKELQASGKCIEEIVPVPPEYQKLREQIDEIQNVMVENIDMIMARGEKIEILVDRAESINTNTFEFRRQAQHLQRLMWWRQKKLGLVLSGALIASLTLISSIKFGFPFSGVWK